MKLVSHSAVRFTERSQQEKKGRKGAAHVLLQVYLNPQQIQTLLQAQFLLWNLFVSRVAKKNLSLRTDGTSLVSMARSGTVGPLLLGGGEGGGAKRVWAVPAVASEAGEVRGARFSRLSQAPARTPRVQEPEPQPPPPLLQRGLTARGAAGEEIGHHVSFALDGDHASVLQ